MKAMIRFVLGWIVSVLATTVIGTVLQTQNVLARLSHIGADIGLADRLVMTGRDLYHFGSVYVIFIAIGLLVAFLAGLLVYRIAGFGRTIIFCVAGAVAMLVMLIAMKEMFFGVQLVAGARDMVGMILQVASGGVGGWLFATLTRTERLGFHPALNVES